MTGRDGLLLLVEERLRDTAALLELVLGDGRHLRQPLQRLRAHGGQRSPAAVLALHDLLCGVVGLLLEGVARGPDDGRLHLQRRRDRSDRASRATGPVTLRGVVPLAARGVGGAGAGRRHDRPPRRRRRAATAMLRT